MDGEITGHAFKWNCPLLACSCTIYVTYLKSELDLHGYVGTLNYVIIQAVRLASLWYCGLWFPLGLPVPRSAAGSTHTWDFCVTVQFLLFWQPPFYPPDFGHIEISLASQGGHELDLTPRVDLEEWVRTQPPFLREMFQGWEEKPRSWFTTNVRHNINILHVFPFKFGYLIVISSHFKCIILLNNMSVYEHILKL